MVLGCGLDVDYPRGSGELRQRTTEAGAVVSELEPDTKPRPVHFPKRNRIVAALSEAVIVVQAAERSGALITSRLARELGVAVGAVPGQAGDPRSVGSNQLLRTGAALVESARDVMSLVECTPNSDQLDLPR